MAVSFLVTLHNAVSPHHFLGSLGLWDDHGRLMDGKEVEVSMSAQVPHDRSEKTRVGQSPERSLGSRRRRVLWRPHREFLTVSIE